MINGKAKGDDDSEFFSLISFRLSLFISYSANTAVPLTETINMLPLAPIVS